MGEVRQRTVMIERWAPLRPAERRFFGDWLAYLAGLAEALELPPEDLEQWRRLRDPHLPGNPIGRPDFYACEGQVLAAGTVPARRPPEAP